VVQDAAAQTGVWVLIDVCPPGGVPETAGVLLADPESDHLYIRFRRDLADLSPGDADILEALPDDLHAKASEWGAERTLAWLGDQWSTFLRSSDRETAAVADFHEALQWLYHRHVRPKVLPFRTHLPLYSLKAAAGRWGPERDVEAEPEDWVEVPEGLRLTPDMFVAAVVGRSMEPLIPAGSLCAFRAGTAVAGSRQGKKVLVMNAAEPGEQRFTVKRYESVKRFVDETREEHTKVVLHPLNPEYESWEIDYEPFDLESSGRIRVIAEFVAVLDP
jgi:phage repressor protein C with HTH and peptisase S24 domain